MIYFQTWQLNLVGAANCRESNCTKFQDLPIICKPRSQHPYKAFRLPSMPITELHPTLDNSNQCLWSLHTILPCTFQLWLSTRCYWPMQNSTTEPIWQGSAQDQYWFPPNGILNYWSHWCSNAIVAYTETFGHTQILTGSKIRCCWGAHSVYIRVTFGWLTPSTAMLCWPLCHSAQTNFWDYYVGSNCQHSWLLCVCCSCMCWNCCK